MTKICCVCSKVEQNGDWLAGCVISTGEQLTHGYCPACYEEAMEDLCQVVNQEYPVRPLVGSFGM